MNFHERENIMFEIEWSEKGVLLPDAKMIREKVFVEEQGFNEEFDSIDFESYHLLLKKNGKAIGTGRIFWGENNRMHIGRVAVLQTCRGGAGKEIINACCEKAKALGAGLVELGAQKRAEGFYLKCGFTSYGDIYYEEYCPHIMMEKTL